MANDITKFKYWTPVLDEVYKQAGVTSVLDGDSTLIRQGANANEILIPRIAMSGLADYSRSNGYVQGDVTMDFQTVAFNYDRGRKFSVDAMDNEETVNLAFGKLASEFIRTKVAPELDAFRFAKYTALAGTKKSEALTDGAAVLKALQDAIATMDNEEVNAEGRHLFIAPSMLIAAQNADTNKVKDILSVFASVHKVPQNRFYTGIDLLSGGTGETAGGYQFADSIASGANARDAACKINFMICDKAAILQYTKHQVNKAIAPDANPDADAWVFNFRCYGLADVYENKSKGVYVSHHNVGGK